MNIPHQISSIETEEIALETINELRKSINTELKKPLSLINSCLIDSNIHDILYLIDKFKF